MRFATWGLVELIEAAERSGKPERAADALQRLSQTTAVADSDWARGIEARSRALVSHGDAAETLYRQAIEALGRSRLRAELARAQLLYGEWLRRERRRLDAREQLRSAHELFTEFGMEAFAEARGSSSRRPASTIAKRTVETRDDLTPGKRRSPAWWQRARRTRRSPHGCSSARAPSTTTCAKHFASSG
jgi:hypothetical protein